MPRLTFLDSIIILISHLERSFHHIWWSDQQLLSLLETYSDLSWRSKVERFAKIVHSWKPSNVFEKSTILDFHRVLKTPQPFQYLYFSARSPKRDLIIIIKTKTKWLWATLTYVIFYRKFQVLNLQSVIQFRGLSRTLPNIYDEAYCENS